MPRRKTNEEFLQQLQVHNPDVQPLEEYINGSTKILVKSLKCGHSWRARPETLIKGHGCPYCANNLKKNTEQFKMDLKHKNPYIKVIGEYVNAITPINVICEICGHVWNEKPARLLSGAQCPNCIKPYTSFMEQFILIAFSQLLGNENVLSRDKVAIGKELDIYIPKYKFAIEPGTWLYHKNKVNNDNEKRIACNKAGIRLFTIYDTYPTDVKPPFKDDCYVFDGQLNEPGYSRMINLIIDILNEMGFEYNISDVNWENVASTAYDACHYNAHENFVSQLNKVNPNITVLETYKGSNIPIQVIDVTCDHGSWMARPTTLLKGIGCPACGRIKAAESKTFTQNEFSQKFSSIHPTITPLEPYTKVTNRIKVKCTVCGKVWEPKAYSLLNGKGCPHCSAVNGARNRSSNNKLATQSSIDFKNRMKSINPNIEILGEYINNKTKIEVKCKLCGNIWLARPDTLIRGVGCPKYRNHNKQEI